MQLDNLGRGAPIVERRSPESARVRRSHGELVELEPERILIIDADPGDALELQAQIMVSLRPGHVDVVGSVELGVESARRLPPDLIVCDLNATTIHGQGSGQACIKKLRRAAPNAVIVATDRQEREIEAVFAIRAGAQDYLVKGDITPLRLRRAALFGAQRSVHSERLSELAYFDSLTGVLRRTPFRDAVQRALSRVRRRGGRIGVVLVDLDRFKDVNDTLGHSAGDALLIEIAQRLDAGVRQSDIAARLSGDEFAILLGSDISHGSATEIATRLQTRLCAPVEYDGREIASSASMGIALSTPDSTVDSLLQQADAAMYQAKRAGRGGFHFFDRAMGRKQRRRRTSERALKNALDLRQFVPHFQPILSSENGVVIGAEALARWPGAPAHRASPEHFLTLIEEQNLMQPLSEMVLDASCHAAAKWRALGHRLTLSVNVSASLFHMGTLPQLIELCLDRHGLRPHDICLELTESVFLRRTAESLKAANELSEMGVAIALDDFGTGFSSLALLRQLPASSLKIDKMFVSDNPQGAVDTAIVSAVVHLARSFGCKIVAEGVETKQQLETLKSLKCEAWQGYLASCALPEREFSEWLRRSNPLTRTTPVVHGP